MPNTSILFTYVTNGLTLKEKSSKFHNRYLPIFCLFVSWSSKNPGGRVDDRCLGKATEGSGLAFKSLDDSGLGFGKSLADSDLALFARFFAAAPLALYFSTAWTRRETMKDNSSESN